ncbi:hypothetical protein Z950_1969 [Sulfitobacter mediterraneus KCTC 32188]|nr:hypothetical protein Z950_1969 [Sulfitobacter mediterraneus KCTC 32188]
MGIRGLRNSPDGWPNARRGFCQRFRAGGASGRLDSLPAAGQTSLNIEGYHMRWMIVFAGLLAISACDVPIVPLI